MHGTKRNGGMVHVIVVFSDSPQFLQKIRKEIFNVQSEENVNVILKNKLH